MATRGRVVSGEGTRTYCRNLDRFKWETPVRSIISLHSHELHTTRRKSILRRERNSSRSRCFHWPGNGQGGYTN